MRGGKSIDFGIYRLSIFRVYRGWSIKVHLPRVLCHFLLKFIRVNVVWRIPLRHPPFTRIFHNIGQACIARKRGKRVVFVRNTYFETTFHGILINYDFINIAVNKGLASRNILCPNIIL